MDGSRPLRILHRTLGLPTEANLFSSFIAWCLSSLLSVELQHVKLSAKAIIGFASAAPNLKSLDVEDFELTCHPAIACAVLAGYCEHIHTVRMIGPTSCTAWRDVQPADVVAAYQSAAEATGHCHRPFTQLRYLQLQVCWCTPPAVWHALLSLFRYAAHLHFARYSPATMHSSSPP